MSYTEIPLLGHFVLGRNKNEEKIITRMYIEEFQIISVKMFYNNVLNKIWQTTL